MRFLILLILLSLSAARAEVGVVKVDSLRVFDLPDGKVVGGLKADDRFTVQAEFRNWVKFKDGWVKGDFLKLENFGDYEVVGKVRRSVALIGRETVAETSNGTVAIPPGSYVMLGVERNGKVYGIYRGFEVSINASSVDVRSGTFDLIVLKRDGTLRCAGEDLRLKVGTPLISLGNGVFISNFRFGRLEFGSLKGKVNPSSVIDVVNNFIDVFNSAKSSSPLAERMGYYCRTLKLKGDDLRFADLGRGRVGVYVNLKHQFFDLHGKPFRERKSRLILKVANQSFWQKLIKLIFSKVPSASFVQVNVERFEDGSFRKLGFVALGRSDFNEGVCDGNLKVFLDRAEVGLDGDIWFFADEVYREADGGNR